MDDEIIYRAMNSDMYLVQPEDCNGDGEQEMYIETISNGLENYVRIKTTLWSISDRKEWIEFWDNNIQPVLDFEDKYRKEDNEEEI